MDGKKLQLFCKRSHRRQEMSCEEWRRNVLASAPTVGNGAEIKESTVPGAGLGLFTTCNFPAGACVGYWHPTQIIPYAEAKQHSLAQSTHYRSLFPMRWVIDGKILHGGDPRTVLTGLGGAGYANDLRKQNNCEFDWMDWPGRTDPFDFSDLNARIIVLRATRPIAAGEELFVSYGDDYWAKRK